MLTRLGDDRASIGRHGESMRRLVTLSILAGTLGVLGAPAGAMGDGAAAGSADVAVAVTVQTQDAGGG